MRYSILVLTGTTLALAATSAALLHQVRTERARAQAEATLRGQWEARFRDLERSRSTPQPSTLPAPASVPEARQDRADTARRPGDVPSARRSADERFLALLATPEGHAQLLKEEKLDLRGYHYPDLAKELRLTSEQEDSLLGAEAEEVLKRRAQHARCRLDSSCDEKSLSFDTTSEQKAVKDLLGAEKFAEYERYQGTFSQRLIVRQLRARLSAANALTDEQAEALIAALHDEGERSAAEGGTMGLASSWAFRFAGAVGGMAGTGELPSDAEVLSSAQESARRIRDRVAELLSAEQMRTFEEIQEEQLAQAQGFLRSRPDARASGQ